LPKKDEYEDEGTWIWLSMACESRLLLAHYVGPRTQKTANQLVAKTARRLASIPLFVTDGLKFYKKALLNQYYEVIKYPSTGKRGRPRSPRLIANALLKYGQIIKERSGSRLKKIVKKIVFGNDIDPKSISTSYIERQNLTLRQDNNRISRKTIGFSKNTEELDNQMTLYIAYYNFCRTHRSLKYKGDTGKTSYNCPAKHAGLIDRVWSLEHLLTFPYHKIPTG
jgi:IS1 family transposase